MPLTRILRPTAMLLAAALLGACEEAKPPAVAKPAATQAGPVIAENGPQGQHPLAGQAIELSILGIRDWLPSELSREMAPEFARYAQEQYGYRVTVSFASSPFATMFDQAAASLATGSQEFNLIISDSQWLGAFAEPGWIVSVSDLIAEVPGLKIEWWDPIVRKAYMEYPEGSDRLWGFPQEADVLALFVREDLFSDPAEREAFSAQYGMDLPQTFEDFESLAMADFEKIARFFTRPERGLYGTILQHSETYDFASIFVYPFVFSRGGEVWDAKEQRVYGVLNSAVNEEALRWNRRMLDYEPPDALHYGVSEALDAFVQGKAATAVQWAAMGSVMIPKEESSDQILVVPPPGFRQKDGSLRRVYPVGGQPWVINAFNDPAHMRAAVDFLQWWYRPETQLEFARRGGNPAVKAALASPDFDGLQRWFRVLKYMLTTQRARDFWHHPKYAELLEVQQHAFAAYAAGRVDDPARVLDYVACAQQEILFKFGSSPFAPPSSCAGLALK